MIRIREVCLLVVVKVVRGRAEISVDLGVDGRVHFRLRIGVRVADEIGGRDVVEVLILHQPSFALDRVLILLRYDLEIGEGGRRAIVFRVESELFENLCLRLLALCS